MTYKNKKTELMKNQFRRFFTVGILALVLAMLDVGIASAIQLVDVGGFEVPQICNSLGGVVDAECNARTEHSHNIGTVACSHPMIVCNIIGEETEPGENTQYVEDEIEEYREAAEALIVQLVDVGGFEVPQICNSLGGAVDAECNARTEHSHNIGTAACSHPMIVCNIIGEENEPGENTQYVEDEIEEYREAVEALIAEEQEANEAQQYQNNNTEYDLGDGSTVDINNKCYNLSGLTSNKCRASQLLGACDDAIIVCNKADDSSLTNVQKTRYKSAEKTDYCLLPENYCFNENLWGEGGVEDYQNDQYAQSWEAIEDGDLGGFLCHQIAGGTEGLFGCDEESGEGPTFILPIEETTFTQFDEETGFEAPDAQGYSPGLTENKGVREFVLNIVNFVLGFLGLAAVIAIIYGGFIYLTAGGDEGKTENGKKSVLYAIIGIILILASYAIVRTVICYAPVGGDDQSSFCRVVGGGAERPQEEIDLTEEVGSSVMTTYESAHARLREIGEGALKVSTAYLNVTSAADYLPTIEYALQGGLDEGIRVLSSIQRSVSDFPRTLENVNLMINYLSIQNPMVTKAGGYFAKSLLANLLVVMSGTPTIVNQTPTFEDAYEFMDSYSPKLKVSAASDYEENIDKYIRYAESLEDLFEEMVDTTGQGGVKGQMTDIKDALALLRVQKANRDLLTNLVKEINEAAEAVKNLEFVKVKLNVSTRSCTAPCIVLFDSIGSVDPSGQTIFDSQHSWDLDGDGRFDETSTRCNEEKVATVSCVYASAGTYTATLKLNSAQPEKFASGIAITRIEVRRPLAKVKVNVSSTDGVSITAMDNTAVPAVRNGRVKFTLEQAKSGLTFNAGGSLGSSGAPVTEFVWSFGGDQFAGSNASKNYSFNEEGSYRVMLEVIENSLSERSIIFVEVGSPSSNFTIQNPYGGAFTTGQTISFDGGFSKSDKGSITEYRWSIVKDGATITENISGNSLWSFIPTAPGEYRVVLQVTDSLGESDINERTFIVESQKPTACFTYSFDDDKQPGTATLRNCSTDPDPADTLAYNWEITNGEFIDGTDAGSKDPIVKFNKKGTQTVKLTVNDQYLDDSIRQEDVEEKQLQVDSVLDIALEVPGGLAYQLDETTNSAEVGFDITSDNAVEFEIDYGDGATEPPKTVLDSAAFAHVYDQAGVYKVKATVYDNDGKDNFITRKVFIGDAISPLPVLTLSVGGLILESDGDLTVTRETSITFDGSDSLNKDGTDKKLLYLINYGDGTVGSNKFTTHIYEDIGIYNVVFTVTDQESGEFGKIELALNVIDAKPIINSLSSHITSGSIETPVTISVSTDSEDLDGSIVQYTWTMFDADDTPNILDTHISNTDQTIFTFHGLGSTGDDNKVGICVKIKDDGGNETDSCTDGPYTYTVAVTGENEPPWAEFSVADSQVKVGDPVIFYDESTDDNEVVKIIYDVLGNGFLDDEPQTVHSFSHVYDKIGTYETRIKVYDINEASSVYGPVDIIVTSSVAEPVAKVKYEVNNLEVSFKDVSVIDPGTEFDTRAWDFDLGVDGDGDGVNDNDVDSTEENPVHMYPASGNYRTKLTITDMQGNTDSVLTTVTAESEPLQARLLLTPAPGPDNIVHLQGTQAEVRTDVSTSTGPIVKYVIDGNINFDSDGDGYPANDADYDYADGRQGLFVYRAEWVQPFTMKLTVEDAEGNESSVAKKIIFDPPETPPSNP